MQNVLIECKDSRILVDEPFPPGTQPPRRKPTAKAIRWHTLLNPAAPVARPRFSGECLENPTPEHRFITVLLRTAARRAAGNHRTPRPVRFREPFSPLPFASGVRAPRGECGGVAQVIRQWQSGGWLIREMPVRLRPPPFRRLREGVCVGRPAS